MFAAGNGEKDVLAAIDAWKEAALKGDAAALGRSLSRRPGAMLRQSAMFDDAAVAMQLTPMVHAKGPSEEIARLLDQKENFFQGGHEAFLAVLPHFLNSPSRLAQAGALQYIIWEPNHPWGKEPQLRARRASLVMSAAPGILKNGDARLHQLLALALGSIQTESSREMLWQMIDGGRASEQSMIALTWIGDARDLPRLAALMNFSTGVCFASCLWRRGIALAQKGCAGNESAGVTPGMRTGTRNGR